MMGNYFGNMTGFGYGFFGMLMMSIFNIAFWALVIWGIVMLVHWFSEQGLEKDKKDDVAVAILKERYAKGGISKEEFEEKKKDLVGE